MENNKKYRQIIILSITLIALTGLCSCFLDDDDSTTVAESSDAVITMTLDSGDNIIGAVELELELPESLAVDADADGNPASGVFLTGADDSVSIVSYNEETGVLKLSMINPEGILSGDTIATLTATTIEGFSFSDLKQLNVTASSISDLNGVEMTSSNVKLSCEIN